MVKKILALATGAVLLLGATAILLPMQSQDKVELKLELPKPMFIGTPRNISSPNLERITGKQYVQIDLKSPNQLNAILIWHYHSQARVYRDVVVQVSEDKDFVSGVTTIFNNDHDNSSGLGVGRDKEYIETAEGKLIDPRGVRARYVRLWSNGNTSNDMNHYVEVEVYGIPAK
jgi:hypothetical protein